MERGAAGTARLRDFQVPKLWFGIGAWNVEMFTKIVDVKPGDTFAASLEWTFTAKGKVAP